MLSACWITQATDTHTEYVTLLFLQGNIVGGDIVGIVMVW